MPLYRGRDARGGSKKKSLFKAAFNWATIFVIALTIFAPLEPAFAQNADASATTDSNSSTSDTPSLNLDQANVDTSTTQPSTTDADTKSAVDPAIAPTKPNINQSGRLPSAPPPSGSTQGPNPQPVAYSSFNQDQLKIDKNTGALSTAYPITIPPGRNNLQPNVDLVYSSQNNQFGSIFGEGWSVNIPYVERLNKNGVDNLYSTSTLNYFTSSLDGEIVSTTTVTSTGAIYVARTENGTFNKYAFTSSTNQWVMTDKSGTQYTFGSSSDSRQSDPNNASDTYKWMLKQITDTNSNNVTYLYFKDAGQIYPSSTFYTGNGTSTGIFEVDFLRTSNPDNVSSSFAGFPIKSNYRVSEIDAKINGTWARKYALTYTTADNGSTTLLNSITESGQNSSGTTVTLPATTFSYQTQNPGWTDASSTWDPPITFSGNNGFDNGTQLADVNSDALTDILSGYTDGTGAGHYDAYTNNGHGWFDSSSTWNPPINFSGNGVDNGARIADLNGDGLEDVISGWNNNTNSFLDTWLNNGHGWTDVSSTWNPPMTFSSNGCDTGVRISDVNGDGLPDIVYSWLNTNFFNAAWLNTGHGWIDASSTWAPPTSFANGGCGGDAGTRLVDVNGDGLPDIIYGWLDNSDILHHDAWINNGHGWTEDASWAPPTSFVNGCCSGSAATSLADVNGDGLPDILYGWNSGTAFHADAWINNGHGWTENASWSPPVEFGDGGNALDSGARLVDVNGDGLPDFLYGITEFDGSTRFAAWTNNNTVRADLLTSVSYPKGGSSTIAYQSAAQYGVNSVPYPVYVVSQITNNDGSGNLFSSSYQYASGTYYYSTSTDHQFAGFNLVTQTDSAGNVTKSYYHTSNGTDSAHGEYGDNFWKIGKMYRVENYDNASNLYKVVITKWDSVTLGGKAAYVFPDQKVELDYDGIGTHKDSAEAYTFNAANGNQTQKTQWGQVTGSTNGTFTDTGSDEYVTNFTYASSTTSSVIGKVADETLTNQSSTKIQETQYFYDGLTLGNVSLGNLTKQLDWKTGSTYIATAQNTYNAYGLITKNLDPRNSTTTYSYDTYNLYPATTTNALSQSTGYQYDYSTGKVKQAIDPNGNPFQTTYDGLGRTLMVLPSNPFSPSTVATKTTYIYTDTANAVNVHESDQLYFATTVDTFSYYDGLGRLIQTRKSAENSGSYKVTDRAYNNVNLLQKESLPYFASSSAKTSATTTASLFTNYTYDPLQRQLTIANAIGTTTNTYTNWKIATTDPRGKEKDIYDDAYGNLVQVDEHNGASTYSTHYTYDGLKDLTNITDALSNVRNFTYDGLGRRLTAEDLHASGDATFGTWNYTFDDAGNLTQQVDPKNQTSTYAYDNVNRVTSESFGGQTQIAYTYDSCANGVTHLCMASSSMALTTSTYDSDGRLSGETKTIGTSTYTTIYAYGRQDNITDITNPDNSVIHYDFNQAGLPEDITYQPSGGSAASVVDNFNYSPTDQPAIITYTNGVTVTNTYDPTKLYRLTQKVGALAGGGGNAQNMSYTYDADGNITQLLDTSISGAGKTVGYSYDDLNRLTNASTTNVSSTPSYNQAFTYDALGNILTGPAGTYSYAGNTGSNYANPDAVTSISVSTSTASSSVIFDASSSFNPSVASTTFTFSLTVTSTANRALVLGITAIAAANTSTGASYNGVAMTQIGDATYPGGIERLTLWYLANPASGTHTVSTTVAVASANVIPAAVSFVNTSGKGNVVTATGSGATSSISINSSNGNMIADFISFAEPTTSTIPSVKSGQTLLMASTTSIIARAGGMAYIKATSSASITNQWNAATEPDYAAGDVELTAPTSSVSATTTFTYDNDGNLVSSGNATNTWNYRNQLTQSVTGAGTSTYAYDYLGQRVSVSNGNTTTYYPETTYSVNSTSRTKHIFAGSLLIASIQDSTSTIGGTASLIQQATSTASSGTSLNTTLAAAPQAGDALILTIGNTPSSSIISSISGGGVTWQKAVKSSVNRDSEIWYGFNSSGSGTSVTTTLSGACTSNCIINISEWSGIATSSALEATSTRNGTSATVTSPTSTTTNANDLIITTEREGGTVTLSSGPTGAFTALATPLSNVGNSAYDIMHATTTTSTSWTFSTSTAFDAVIAAFKASATSTVATTTKSYILDDNLGGTNVVINAAGTGIAEVLDYYPYGAIRIDSKSGGYPGESRKYIGQEYDATTQLSYLNARYYDGSRGQFMSQDPVFLIMGSSNQVKKITSQDQAIYLEDPQQLNSYEYARGNPLSNSDPQGKTLWQISGGITTGPLGINVGLRWEPGVGWQLFSAYSVGLAVGASLQYDPSGHLNPEMKGGDTYYTSELDIVPIIGGYQSKSVKQDILNFPDFSNAKADKGWAFGFQFGYEFGVEHEGNINYTNNNSQGSAGNSLQNTLSTNRDATPKSSQIPLLTLPVPTGANEHNANSQLNNIQKPFDSIL